MANKLKFKITYSIVDFKALQSNNVIDVINNPHTNKLFFNCGSATGAVSDDYKGSPIISLVCGDDGVDFWLLHKKQSNNVVDTL